MSNAVPRAPTPLVIRHPSWWQSAWGRTVVAVGLLTAGTVLYFIGRAGLGVDGPHWLATSGDLRNEIRARDAQIRDLRQQVAELDISITPMHPERELRAAGAVFESATAFRDFFANHVVVDGRLVTGQNQNAGAEVANLMMKAAGGTRR